MAEGGSHRVWRLRSEVWILSMTVIWWYFVFKRSLWLLCGEWPPGPSWKQGHHLVGCCSLVGDDGGCWYPGTGGKGTSSRRCGTYRRWRLSHKKEWKAVIHSNTTRMDLVIITLSDGGQTEEDKYHMILHVETKKECRWLYIYVNKTETDL